MPNLYDGFDTAGAEISSTYEGRHITLYDSLWVHPTHTDGFVDAKDPVISGNIVGVALIDGASANDQISVDTEGIWALSVVATDDEGASAIVVGDIIYINRTTAVLSKISSHTTNVPFGYALMSADTDDVIAVKVHWNMWTDVYRDYIAGGAAEAALLVDVNDATTLATGYGQGIVVDYNNTGDKTGDAEIQGIAIDQINSGNVTYMYGETIYQVQSVNPEIGFAAALSIYQDELGTAMDGAVCIDMGMSSTNSPSGRHSFMRMRNHNAANPPESMIIIEGTPGTDYMVDFPQGSTPIVIAAVGGNQTHKIAVRVAGVDFYIPLHTA